MSEIFANILVYDITLCITMFSLAISWITYTLSGSFKRFYNEYFSINILDEDNGRGYKIDQNIKKNKMRLDLAHFEGFSFILLQHLGVLGLVFVLTISSFAAILTQSYPAMGLILLILVGLFCSARGFMNNKNTVAMHELKNITLE